MIAVAVRFLAGRYHATPWGRHVNEGVPEWPPSSWRLLRALISSWKRTRPDLSVEQVSRVVRALTAPPSVWLPRASVGHSRHYMPLFRNWFRGANDTTLVFDTFVAVPREEEVRLIWPEAGLDPDDKEVLAALLEGVTYLGRAESWCQARLDLRPPEPNCLPFEPGEAIPSDTEPVRTLVPRPDKPDVVLESLLVETAELRSRQRRLDPSGSRWVFYARPRRALDAVPSALHRAVDPHVMVAARFALDRRPLPPIQETLVLGERARRVAMGCYGRMFEGEVSPVLAGRDANGPLKGHRHAFYLATDEDGDGRLDHLTVYAPAGLGSRERAALGSIQEIPWGASEVDEGRRLKVMLLGFLRREELGRSSWVFEPTRKFVSRTPFVLTRYPRTYKNGRPRMNEFGEQVDGPEDQVRREWEQRRELDPSLPRMVAVRRRHRLELETGIAIRWLTFRMLRVHGGGSSSGFAYGLTLEFEESVAGPLALGYACHYGLGQFVPLIAETHFATRRLAGRGFWG